MAVIWSSIKTCKLLGYTDLEGSESLFLNKILQYSLPFFLHSGGYPDPDYLDRLKTQLGEKGFTYRRWSARISFLTNNENNDKNSVFSLMLYSVYV